MIKKTLVYPKKIELKLELRGGETCYCFPQAELHQIDDYQCFEIGFIFSTTNYGVLKDYLKLLNENCENWLCYDFSPLDNNLVAPYCTKQDLERIENILTPLGYDGNEQKQQNIKKPTGVICRVCKEFNPFADSDNITNELEYTCWGCGTNPSRYRIGLTTNIQVEKLRQIYKGKGFWSK